MKSLVSPSPPTTPGSGCCKETILLSSNEGENAHSSDDDSEKGQHTSKSLRLNTVEAFFDRERKRESGGRRASLAVMSLVLEETDEDMSTSLQSSGHHSLSYINQGTAVPTARPSQQPNKKKTGKGGSKGISLDSYCNNYNKNCFDELSYDEDELSVLSRRSSLGGRDPSTLTTPKISLSDDALSSDSEEESCPVDPRVRLAAPMAVRTTRSRHNRRASHTGSEQTVPSHYSSQTTNQARRSRRASLSGTVARRRGSTSSKDMPEPQPSFQPTLQQMPNQHAYNAAVDPRYVVATPPDAGDMVGPLVSSNNFERNVDNSTQAAWNMSSTSLPPSTMLAHTVSTSTAKTTVTTTTTTMTTTTTTNLIVPSLHQTSTSHQQVLGPTFLAPLSPVRSPVSRASVKPKLIKKKTPTKVTQKLNHHNFDNTVPGINPDALRRMECVLPYNNVEAHAPRSMPVTPLVELHDDEVHSVENDEDDDYSNEPMTPKRGYGYNNNMTMGLAVHHHHHHHHHHHSGQAPPSLQQYFQCLDNSRHEKKKSKSHRSQASVASSTSSQRSGRRRSNSVVRPDQLQNSWAILDYTTSSQLSVLDKESEKMNDGGTSFANNSTDDFGSGPRSIGGNARERCATADATVSSTPAVSLSGGKTASTNRSVRLDDTADCEESDSEQSKTSYVSRQSKSCVRRRNSYILQPESSQQTQSSVNFSATGMASVSSFLLDAAVTTPHRVSDSIDDANCSINNNYNNSQFQGCHDSELLLNRSGFNDSIISADVSNDDVGASVLPSLPHEEYDSLHAEEQDLDNCILTGNVVAKNCTTVDVAGNSFERNIVNVVSEESASVLQRADTKSAAPKLEPAESLNSATSNTQNLSFSDQRLATAVHPDSDVRNQHQVLAPPTLAHSAVRERNKQVVMNHKPLTSENLEIRASVNSSIPGCSLRNNCNWGDTGLESLSSEESHSDCSYGASLYTDSQICQEVDRYKQRARRRASIDKTCIDMGALIEAKKKEKQSISTKKVPTFKPAAGVTDASDFILRCFCARLRLGVTVIKHNRSRWSKSLPRLLQLSPDGKSLSWTPIDGEKDKGKRPQLDLTKCKEVRHAFSPDPQSRKKMGTNVIRKRCKSEGLANKSFALIFAKRTLDMTALSTDQCKVLMEGFSALCFRLQLDQLEEKNTADDRREFDTARSQITDDDWASTVYGGDSAVSVTQSATVNPAPFAVMPWGQ